MRPARSAVMVARPLLVRDLVAGPVQDATQATRR